MKTRCCTGAMKYCCESNECRGWQQFRGQNPQTGQEIDKWECVHVMIPILLIENARQLRSVAAAAESSRNVVAKKIDDYVASIPQYPARHMIGE